VYVRDRTSGHTDLVTVVDNPSGSFAAGGREPSISADGRYVAFSSRSPEYRDDPDDDRIDFDVFVADRGMTDAAGAYASTNPAVAGGRLPTFRQVSLFFDGSISGYNAADGIDSGFPSISGDGSQVAFLVASAGAFAPLKLAVANLDSNGSVLGGAARVVAPLWARR
jgi:Tol biopolymer transport system component